MLIKFKSKALEKEFCNEKTLKRRWGGGAGEVDSAEVNRACRSRKS